MKSLFAMPFVLGMFVISVPSLLSKELALNDLLAVIKPQPGEDRWAQINWRTDLWEARKEAAAKGKPILLWEMDGHPLGCV